MREGEPSSDKGLIPWASELTCKVSFSFLSTLRLSANACVIECHGFNQNIFFNNLRLSPAGKHRTQTVFNREFQQTPACDNKHKALNFNEGQRAYCAIFYQNKTFLSTLGHKPRWGELTDFNGELQVTFAALRTKLCALDQGHWTHEDEA